MGLTYGNVSPTQIIYGGGGSSTIFSGASTTTIDDGKQFSSFVTGLPITNSALKWKISGTITYNQYLFSATAIEQTKTFREISLVTGQPTYLLNEELLDNNGLVQYGQIYLTSNGQDIEITDACMKMFDSTHKKYTGFEALNITITKVEAELGTELTQLVYGSTTSWVKPFTLSTSQGSNVTLTVKRTSSLNPEATIGNLSSGSIIYYGDELTVSYTLASGYKINRHTINNVNFTSGDTISVTESLHIAVTAEQSLSWHSLWTGSTVLTTTNQNITRDDNLSTKFRVYLSTKNNQGGNLDSMSVEIERNGSATISGWYTDWEIDEDAQEDIGRITLTLALASGIRYNVGLKLNSTAIGYVSGESYTVTVTKIEGFY